MVMIDAHPEDEAEITRELDCRVAREELEYADTYRATPYDRGCEEHEAKIGCCGQYDITYVCKSGRKYLIGLNYGH